MKEKELKEAIESAQERLIEYIEEATRSNDPIAYFTMMNFLKDNSKVINENYNIDLGGLANGIFKKPNQ